MKPNIPKLHSGAHHRNMPLRRCLNFVWNMVLQICRAYGAGFGFLTIRQRRTNFQGDGERFSCFVAARRQTAANFPLFFRWRRSAGTLLRQSRRPEKAAVNAPEKHSPLTMWSSLWRSD
jgi:hypothetical protein